MKEIDKIVFKKLLSNPELLNNYLNRISAQDFSNSIMRIVITTLQNEPSLLAYYAPTKEFFNILLRDKIANREELDKACIILSNIAKDKTETGDIELLIKDLKSNRMCKEMTEIIRDTIPNIVPEKIEDAYNNLLKKLVSLPLQNISDTIVAKIRDINNNIEERIKDYYNQRRALIPTTIKAFDAVMGGFAYGELAVVSAASGHGKSALMLWWAEQMVERGMNVLYITIEMSYEETMNRYHAIQTGFPALDIAQRKIPSKELPLYFERIIARSKEPNVRDAFLMECKSIPDRNNINYALDLAKKYPNRKGKMFIMDIEMCSPGRIDQEIQKLKVNGHKLDCVFVDFINVMEPDFYNKDKVKELGSIARSLKKIARKHEVLVFTAAQLNSVPLRGDGKEKVEISTDSVKYAKAISENADWLFAFFRTEEDDLLKQIKLRLIKHRHSAACTALLEFDFSNMQVKDLGFSEDSFVPYGYERTGERVIENISNFNDIEFNIPSIKETITNNAIETKQDQDMHQNIPNETEQEQRITQDASETEKEIETIMGIFGNSITNIYKIDKGENE